MAQVFLNPEPWTHGTPVFGTYLGGWLGVKQTGWGTNTGKFGHRGVAGSVECYASSSSSYEGGLHGFVRREEIEEDGSSTQEMEVKAIFIIRPESPPVPLGMTAVDAMLGGMGLVARLQNGSINEPPANPTAGWDDPEVYISGADAYGAYFKQSPTAGALRAQIVRWDLGVETVLASVDKFPNFQGHDFFATPVTLQLKVGNDGAGGVVLEFWYKLLDLSDTLGESQGHRWAPARNLTQLLTHTDSSGSKIITQGRSGMIFDKETRVAFDPGGGSVNVDMVTACSLIEFIGSTAPLGAANVVRIRDEFLRPVIFMGLPETNRWGASLVNMQTDGSLDRFSKMFKSQGTTPWTGGSKWLNGYQGFPIERDTTGASGLRVVTPINTTAQEQLSMLTTEEPSSDAQRYRITFNHVSATSGDAGHKIGLALRLQQPTGDGTSFSGLTLDNFQGYTFSIDGDGLCEVWRRQFSINANAAPTEDDSVLLASLDISHSTATRTLEAEVFEEAGPMPAGQNPNILKLLIDGGQIVFTTTSVAGVTIDASGNIRDASQYRIPESGAMGLYIGHPTTDGVTTHTARIHQIEQLSPTKTTANDNDLLSVSVASETDGVTGTLTLTPEWDVRKERHKPIVKRRFESGSRQIWPLVTKQRLTWTLVHRSLEAADLDTLEDFYDDHDGSEIPFNWTPPGLHSVAGIYKFATPIKTARRPTPSGEEVWTAEFDLIESVSP